MTHYTVNKKSTGKEIIQQFYSRFQPEDRVLIVINADPDALASAMAVKRLLWRKVANVSMASINQIKRPDNIAMVRLLKLKLFPLKEMDIDKYNRFVIVDSQPAHNDAFRAFIPDVVIDHHPKTDVDASFIDIRPHYGATATIATEYIRAAKIKPSASLASALFHAIKTDTKSFERPSVDEDMRAFRFLFRHANIHLVRKMEQSDLRLDFLKYFKDAIDKMCIRKSKVFVHLGPVMNPDICVLIGDFFMRVNPMTWSIVSGVYEDRLIIIFRNDGIRKNAGNLASQAFGQLGSAGGHKSMARAEIPLANLSGLVDPDNSKDVCQWIVRQVEFRKKQKCHIPFKKELLGLTTSKG